MSGEVGLRLLARQDAEYMWELMTEEVIIPRGDSWCKQRTLIKWGIAHFSGAFPNWEILSLQDATNWVLELMQIYLTSGITPAFYNRKPSENGGKLWLCKTKS